MKLSGKCSEGFTNREEYEKHSLYLIYSIKLLLVISLVVVTKYSGPT